MFSLKCRWPSSAVPGNVKYAGLPVWHSAGEPLYSQTIDIWGMF